MRESKIAAISSLRYRRQGRGLHESNCWLQDLEKPSTLGRIPVLLELLCALHCEQEHLPSAIYDILAPIQNGPVEAPSLLDREVQWFKSRYTSFGRGSGRHELWSKFVYGVEEGGVPC